MDRKQTLIGALDRASRVYYHTGVSPYSDEQFDAMLTELATLDPANPRIHQVGSAVPADTMLRKYKHTVRTNSLKKVDSEAELLEWHKKYGSRPLTIELKADGSTVIAYYINGILDTAATRGGDDGIGQDITQNAMKFKGLPSVIRNTQLGQSHFGEIIPFTGAVRGEALLTHDDYEKIDPLMFGNSRNIGTGIIQRSDGINAELITFLAFTYEATGSSGPGTPKCESAKLAGLDQMGFEVIPYTHCDFHGAIDYWKDIDKKRKGDQLPFRIDGIVFKIDDCSDNPEASQFSSGRPNSERVLKFEAPGGTTQIIGVQITEGHSGVLKPTADLVSINIDNTNIDSAQLNNWEIIQALDIAIGDTVRVIKAKDIIPMISCVIDRRYTCPKCGFMGTLAEQEAHHVRKG